MAIHKPIQELSGFQRQVPGQLLKVQTGLSQMHLMVRLQHIGTAITEQEQDQLRQHIPLR